MKTNDLKLPAYYTALSAEESTFLSGGAIEDTDTWSTVLTIGQAFNYIARIFSASSSIINNLNTIFVSITALNKLLGAALD